MGRSAAFGALAREARPDAIDPTSGRGPSEPRRILIVRLSHLGDVLHALPLYHALRAAFPSASLGWVVQPEFAPLLAELPEPPRVFLFGRRDGFAAWPRLRAELVDWGPDWVIDAQGNTKSAMVALAAGAPRRTGPALCDWTERFAGQSFHERAEPAEGPHAIDRAWSLVRRVAPGAALDARLPLCAERLATGAERLDERLPDSGGSSAVGPLWIVALSSEDDPRSWPAAHFEALARALFEAGGRVLVLSGPAEEELGARLAERLPARARGGAALAHWIGQRGLGELACVFGAAAARGARLVACDSGPMHLAAAVGLPVRLLAGPQAPERTGPWPIARELRPYRVRAISSGFPADELEPTRTGTPSGGWNHPRSGGNRTRLHALGTAADGMPAGGRATAPRGDASPSPHRTLRRFDPPECQPCLHRRCTHPRGPVCLTELEPREVAERLLAERWPVASNVDQT